MVEFGAAPHTQGSHAPLCCPTSLDAPHPGLDATTSHLTSLLLLPLLVVQVAVVVAMMM